MFDTYALGDKYQTLENLIVLSSCEGVTESVYTALNLFAKSHKDTSSLSGNIHLTV